MPSYHVVWLQMCLAVSPDGCFLAALAKDPYRSAVVPVGSNSTMPGGPVGGACSVLLFHAASLEPFMRIETDALAYSK